MATGLAQWLGTGEWPPAINWVAILAGCTVAAATQVLAFLSKTYGDWEASRVSNGIGAGNGHQPETEPK